MPGPVCSAACSVASPISQASGTSASAASTKSAVSPGCARWSTRDRGGREGERRPEDPAATARVAYPAVLEAVLFDWGDTLMQLGVGSRAARGRARRRAARAIGREPVPALTERFRDAYLPLLCGRARSRRSSTRARRGSCSPSSGSRSTTTSSTRFLGRSTRPGRRRAARGTTHALLEALRERGLKLGLVSNAFDPAALLHADLEQIGVAERLDVAVFSSEVGRRKPHPAIFERALERARRRARRRRSSSATRSRGHPRRGRARHARPCRRCGSGPTTTARRPSRTSGRSRRWTS